MHLRSIILFVLTLLFISSASALPTAEEWRISARDQFGALTRAEIDPFITPLITYNLSNGLMVVVIDQNGYAEYSYGVADALSGGAPDNTTLFDMGSVSKVMTGLLMADAEIRGEYNLSMPVNEYLPGEFRLPDDEGVQITGVDLATHRSGLPGVPDQFASTNPASTRADQVEESMQHYQMMTADETYTWLANSTLLAPPGYEYLYSNLGSAVAGDVVARATGTPYSRLLETRVFVPLGMTGSGASWSMEDLKKRATGYRAYEYPTDEAHLIRFNEFWTACGGVHSNAEDMAVFLAAQMSLIDSPLAGAMAKSQQSYANVSAGPPRLEQGLFWDIIHNRDDTIIYKKAGETNAHQAAIAFNPSEKTGVVILSNTAHIDGVHIQDQAVALLEKMHVRMKYR